MRAACRVKEIVQREALHDGSLGVHRTLAVPAAGLVEATPPTHASFDRAISPWPPPTKYPISRPFSPTDVAAVDCEVADAAEAGQDLPVKRTSKQETMQSREPIRMLRGAG
jgi:hypothetical protein